MSEKITVNGVSISISDIARIARPYHDCWAAGDTSEHIEFSEGPHFGKGSRTLKCALEEDLGLDPATADVAAEISGEYL